MLDPNSALLGDHALPLRFAGPSPRVSQQRRKRTGLVLGVTGALLVAASLGAVQLGANLGFDDAQDRFDAAVRATTSTIDEVGTESDDLKSSTASASKLLESDDGTLVDAATKDVLATAVADAEASAAVVDGMLSTDLPDPQEKPIWFWELFAGSSRLTAEREDVAELNQELTDESPAIVEAEGTVSDVGLSLLSTAASAAAAFETAHITAKNDDVITLRKAATAAAAAKDLDDAAVASFVALQSAAAGVISSEQTELAEKAGPLLSTRLEIEAFARSLTPGVLLEFDWNPIVSGAGDRGSMGGLTTWWWDSPGRAVIELSNSVAEQWPSYSSKSLVAHEVGHAISVKCQSMYDASTQDSIEKWATAWAISMGYTDDANGVWAYGYPPQSYIDAASGCR